MATRIPPNFPKLFHLLKRTLSKIKRAELGTTLGIYITIHSQKINSYCSIRLSAYGLRYLPEHANNLDSLVRLFKRLGRPEVASRFIQTWIEERRDNRIEELGPDSYHMFGPLQDQELRDALAAAYVRNRTLPDVRTAFNEMALNGGMNRDAIAVLAAASIDDLVEAIDVSPGDRLTGSISNTLKLGDHPQEPASAIARERMRDALRRIAGRSELQRDRVRSKFGVRLDEGEDSAAE